MAVLEQDMVGIAGVQSEPDPNTVLHQLNARVAAQDAEIAHGVSLVARLQQDLHEAQVAAAAQQAATAGLAAQLAATQSKAGPSTTSLANSEPVVTRLLSQLRLDKWNGDRNGDFDTWLYNLDRYLEAVMEGATDKQKLPFVGLQMTDYAALWWKVLMDSKDAPTEWAAVRKLLIQEYHSELRELAARDKLNGARMTRGLAQYITYVRSLHLQIPDLPDCEKMYRFLYGLTPQLQARIRALRPMPATFAEMVSTALVMEDSERVAHKFFQIPKSMAPKFAPRSATAEPGDYTPMEIGALGTDQQPEGRQGKRDISNDTCYNCGKKGHHAIHCRKKRDPNRRGKSRPST
jgi:hypothetical protein